MLINAVGISYILMPVLLIIETLRVVKKVANRVEKPYLVFINFDLYKSHFSLRLLGSAKENRVKRPVISLVKNGYCKLENYLVQPKSNYSEIWPQTFSFEKPKKDEFQPIKDKTALS